LPSFLALDSPMAMACFGFVTFFPLRPDLSLPRFISRISVSTFLPAEGEYLRSELFFLLLFFVLLFFVLLDFFFVGIVHLLDSQMAGRRGAVVSSKTRVTVSSRNPCRSPLLGVASI